MVLIISRNQVMSLVTMAESIEAVENAFRELARGTARMPTRVTVSMPEKQAWLGVMPAFLSQAGSLATKIVTVYENNVTRHGLPNVLAAIILNDVETGRVEAVIEGSYITAIRTGAVSGVATRYLARQNATKLGIFGCGVQGRTQLEAICQVRKISSVLVYDREEARMEDFVSKFTSQVKIQGVEKTEDVIRDSEIIATATTSTTPVFNGEDVKPGTHINAIGAFTPDTRELDDRTISKAKIVVDSLTATMEEAGDILIPLREGVIRREDIWAELGEIVAGFKPGRTTDDEITVFKSVGLAIQDAAVARLVFEKARINHVGSDVVLAD